MLFFCALPFSCRRRRRSRRSRRSRRGEGKYFVNALVTRFCPPLSNRVLPSSKEENSKAVPFDNLFACSPKSVSLILEIFNINSGGRRERRKQDVIFFP